MGSTALRIEHIGSTAVPGIWAKPVIDVLVAVADVRDPGTVSALSSAGYELRVDESGHRMFRNVDADAHVHLWSAQEDIERHLTFRDWLRGNDEERALYEHVKRQLTQREWRSQNDYAEAKTPVVSAILRRANGRHDGPRVESFAELILKRLPQRASVLEIGAGEGRLARILARAGHDVTALDRHLRSSFPIVETSFEDYDAGTKRFDCVAAQLVLHHADGLDAFLEKIHLLLKPGGFVAVDDYGWERSDDPAFRKEREDLLTSETTLAALRKYFREDSYFDHAYLEEGAGTDLLGYTFFGIPVN